MKGLIVLVAAAPLLLAGCGDQNACDHPPPEIGSVVIEAQASADPCAGQPPLRRRARGSRHVGEQAGGDGHACATIRAPGRPARARRRPCPPGRR